jgi:hypothetical protein
VNTQRPGDPPIEYQAASASAATLRALPDPEHPGAWPYDVAYRDHVANMVVFTVRGVEFHAAITSA